MDNHREEYDKAMQNFTEFTQSLIEHISTFDSEVAAADLNAKDCIPKLNRDLRFSKNKAPYKTYLYCIICSKGRKVNDANYGVFIDPGQSFIFSGTWQPEPKHLKQIREKIDYDYEGWLKIAQGKDLLHAFPDGVVAYETLKRVPAGYQEDNPALDYLKMKGYAVKKQLADSFFQANKNLDTIVSNFKTCGQLQEFLKKED
jgi:uncharacterized protein (TIGR02453 family)